MTPEQAEILGWFTHMLTAPTADGGRKRSKGEKPSWKVDTSHEPAIYSHLNKWKHGMKVDPDSGTHPLVHLAWRALAIAWQETHGGNTPDPDLDPALSAANKALQDAGYKNIWFGLPESRDNDNDNDTDNPYAAVGLSREDAENALKELASQEWLKRTQELGYLKDEVGSALRNGLVKDALQHVGYDLYPTVEEKEAVEALIKKYGIKDCPSENTRQTEFTPDPQPENPKSPPSPRVFVAAPWPIREEARRVMKRLENAGATITYDWTDAEVDMTCPTVASEELRYLCLKDTAGVLSADYLLVLPTVGHDTLGRGTWAEVGLALGSRISVIIWPYTGDHLLDLECIYALHPDVQVAHTWDCILEKIGLPTQHGC